MSIGDNIKKRRQKLNMSQDELANKIFVTRQTISNYEVGKSKPSIEMLETLAAALDCELDYLVYGKREDKYKQLIKHILWLVTIAFAYYISFKIQEHLSIIQAVTYKIHPFPIFMNSIGVPFLRVLIGVNIGGILYAFKMRIHIPIPMQNIVKIMIYVVVLCYSIIQMPLLINFCLDGVFASYGWYQQYTYWIAAYIYNDMIESCVRVLFVAAGIVLYSIHYQQNKSIIVNTKDK